MRPATLLIAVSGGSDSTGLLVALAKLCATGRYPALTLHACTIDHGLRTGSREEALWVEALCKRYGVPHITRRWEGDKPGAGLQAAARAKRYALLVDAALDVGADAIVSAHTRDDQAETIAMRAERAPEGIGLSGMAEGVLLNGSVWLLRPFLRVDRFMIRTFLAAQRETWIDDPSNANPRFERVRVRQRGSVPGATRANGERAAVSQRAADFVAGNVRVEHGCFLLAPPAVDVTLSDPAAWRGLLLLAVTAGGRVHGLESASAERLRDFLASGRLSRTTAGRVVFDRRRDGLYLYRECRGIEALLVPAGATGVWDRRYRVANPTDRAVIVTATGDRETRGAGLRGPALRAGRALPSLTFEDGGRVADAGVTVEPVIAPYAAFLPLFDLPLANALADILGGAPFPSPPNE
jgi:tRNA(Ile)-lysidine synthase